MATKFLARPLQVLDRLYRFLEGQSPQLVELDLPVQVVHDVSRQAELGAPVMGFFIAGQDCVHVGAGVVEEIFNPYDEVSYLFPNVTDLWVWLVSSFGSSTTSAIDAGSGVTMTIGYVPYGEAIVRRDVLVDVWTTAYGIHDQNVAPATHAYGLVRNSNVLTTKLPLPIFPGSTVRCRSVATGALTTRIQGLFWAGPMGVLPPGM